MSTSARTAASLLLAAAAAVGIGLAVAAPAMATPGEPVLPPNPFTAHETATTNLITHLPDREIPGNPVRVVTGAFGQFNQRFGGVTSTGGTG
ncbi:MAG: hypothetical protein QOH91_1019 [Mycobacterium sp.]|jgi:hypothetical protein|nr:hypothetical protein [Mycobacterium sp.]